MSNVHIHSTVCSLENCMRWWEPSKRRIFSRLARVAMIRDAQNHMHKLVNFVLRPYLNKPGQVCREVLAWVSYNIPLVTARFISVLCGQQGVWSMICSAICKTAHLVIWLNVVEVDPWKPGGSRLLRQGRIHIEVVREFQVLEGELSVQPASPRLELDCHRLANFVHMQDFPDCHRELNGCFVHSSL